MNDERLSKYQINDERAEQYVKLQNDLDRLKIGHTELSDKNTRLESELKNKSQEDIDKDPEKYHDIRQEFESSSQSMSQSNSAIEAKEMEIKRYKAVSQEKSIAQEAEIPTQTPVPSEGRGVNLSQPELNERLAPTENIQDWNGRNEPNPINGTSKEQVNDDRLNSYLLQAESPSQEEKTNDLAQPNHEIDEMER